MITHAELVEVLRKEVEAAGGQAKWAHAHRVSKVYVGDILMGSATLGPKVQWALGYERVVRYRKIEGDNQ